MRLVAHTSAAHVEMNHLCWFQRADLRHLYVFDAKRASGLLSATMDPDILDLTSKSMCGPVHILVKFLEGPTRE